MEALNKKIGTHEKALRINLDSQRYGTIAEIGAGQEVSAWFFRVGGASGTIAKTMSAYDMKFSDDIYGEVDRYVSRERLLAMLQHEYSLLEERLGELRGENSAFFAFADTISAKSYHGTNISHGWIGVRFQMTPRSPVNDIILHVNLRDPSALQQQQAVGILGVNLLYSAFFQLDNLKEFFSGLLDELSLERLDVDSIEAAGPAFQNIDNRWLGLQILVNNIGYAVAFPKNGGVKSPMDIVYKMPIVIERGIFQDIDPRHIDMLRRGLAVLNNECEDKSKEPVPLLEMTLRDVHGKEQELNEVFSRMQVLQKKGFDVLVTVFPEYYHLTRFLNRYTSQPIRFVVGAVSVLQLLSEKYYSQLSGGLVEAMGRLMAANVRIYVFAMDREAFLNSRAYLELGENWNITNTNLVSLSSIEPKDSSRHLYRYLVDVKALEALDP
jgi:hypothetical protein